MSGILQLVNTFPSGGFAVKNSLRFRSSASAYLNRTFGTPTNNKIWTWSGWVKRGSLAQGGLHTAVTSASNISSIIFVSDQLRFLGITGGTLACHVQTTQVFRDPSAWYHIVVTVDTTQATASNRVKFYVNGTQVTAFSTATYPALNYNSQINQSGIGNYIGDYNEITSHVYFDGYMAEVNFVDGQALTPSSFGAFDATSGVWQPVKYAGTYGTNGFYLKFSDTTSTTTLCYDYSGNSNNWTPNNISLTAGSTYDSMLDSPTNFDNGGNGVGNYAVLNPLVPGASALSNGNLTSAGSTVYPTIQPTSGNWYFEINGVAKNWTPPAAFPTGTGDFNFGQRPFANTPTSGYKALNTQNLPTPSIVNGANHMAATTYTGTGSSLSISNSVNSASFQPDFVWIKSRSAATDHALYDVIRWTQNRLESNTTDAAVAADNGLTAFGSSGFTVNTLAQVNTNAATYVGWQWKAGGTAVTNTAGSITSQVSANTTAGFSVVTFTCQSSGSATIGHGLGVAPSLIIMKQRGGTAGWATYHASLGNTQYLALQDTAAAATLSTVWNNTSPTSTVWSIGTAFVGLGNYVAYCFAAIPGYSAFGSYTGNGSTDGPFVYTGFRPRWILVKRTDVANSWVLMDSSRSSFNYADKILWPNLSDAEANGGTTTSIDFVSNGFKQRGTGASINASGGTYIYAAFAENPLKYSLAR